VAIYLRLSPQKGHNNASWATLILCGAWIIPSILIILVDCELNEPLAVIAEQCKNLVRISNLFYIELPQFCCLFQLDDPIRELTLTIYSIPYD